MDQGQPIESLDSGSAEQEITGRIGGDRHLGLDLDDFDCVKRNGAHLRDHAFTFTILQATVEYCASWLFLLLFAAKYEPATSLRKKRNLVPPMDRRSAPASCCGLPRFWESQPRTRERGTNARIRFTA
jgi:hypothetical protein